MIKLNINGVKGILMAKLNKNKLLSNEDTLNELSLMGRAESVVYLSSIKKTLRRYDVKKN